MLICNGLGLFLLSELAGLLFTVRHRARAPRLDRRSR